MGHYRQWLQYREIDQHLRTQLSELELELARLQQEADGLGCDLSLSDNEIIQALIGQKKAQAVVEAIWVERAMNTGQADTAASAGTLVGSGGVPQHNGANGTLQTYAAGDGADSLQAEEANPLLVGGSLLPSYTVSPALFGWSNLTDFDERQAPAIPVTLSSFPAVPIAPVLPAVHQEPNLLPEDMLSFLDMHARNSVYHPTPYADPPWWLASNAGSTPADLQERGPVDQQSIRTDLLIQRWRERWGRGAPDSRDHQHQSTRQEGQV
jgi:hypothetical protein